MTDRFQKIRALSFAAVGLSVAFGGCSRTEQQAQAPATKLAQQAEPPRLFPEGAFEPTMDAPLTLDSASMTALAENRKLPSLRVPDADGNGFGDDAELMAETPVENSSDNLTLPPSDRTVALETADDEAPLPELLPFETPAALAEHADAPMPDGVDDAATIAEDDGTAPSPGEIVDAPVEEAPIEEFAEPSEAEVAVTPELDAVVESQAGPAITPEATSETAPAATDIAQETLTTPPVSTGALSINNIKSVGAAERQVARLKVPVTDAPATASAPAATPSEIASTPPGSTATPAAKSETKPAAAASTAASPAAVAQQPTSEQPSTIASPVVTPTEVAATPQIPTPSIVLSSPPAPHESAAVTPNVTPLKAKASPSDVAAAPQNQSLEITAPTFRPTAPSLPSARSTAAAPPRSVAIERSADAVKRAPLPALPLPPQPALLAESEQKFLKSAEPQLAPAKVAAKPQQPSNPMRKPDSIAEHRPQAAEQLPAARPPVATPDRIASNPMPQSRPTTPVAPQRVQASPAIPTVPAVPAQPAAEPFVSHDRALPPADAAPPMRSAELIAVSRLADEHTRRAFDLAGRRAMYSARNEFIEALQIMAHAIDAEQHTNEHSQALADGLTAIKESDDFVSQGGRLQDNIDVIRLAKPHTTPVLKGLQPNSVSRLGAMQQYYTYAQRRLAFAVGREPSGSLALYGLGKLHSVLSQQPAQGIASAEPKAIVFHQAALLVDSRNYMAANDLGVLLARYGKYSQAKAALLHSLEVSPQPATWHNLTVVHQQLGEVRLAQLAHSESRAAAQKAKQLARSRGQTVTDNATVVWLDPATFSRSSEMWSPPTPNGPDASPTATPQTASKPAATPPAAASKRGFFRK